MTHHEGTVRGNSRVDRYKQAVRSVRHESSGSAAHKLNEEILLEAMAAKVTLFSWKILRQTPPNNGTDLNITVKHRQIFPSLLLSHRWPLCSGKATKPVVDSKLPHCRHCSDLGHSSAEEVLFSPRRMFLFFWKGKGDEGKAGQLLVLFLQEGESEEMTEFKKQMLALLLALHSRVERTEAVQEQQDQALQV